MPSKKRMHTTQKRARNGEVKGTIAIKSNENQVIANCDGRIIYLAL